MWIIAIENQIGANDCGFTQTHSLKRDKEAVSLEAIDQANEQTMHRIDSYLADLSSVTIIPLVSFTRSAYHGISPAISSLAGMRMEASVHSNI